MDNDIYLSEMVSKNYNIVFTYTSVDNDLILLDWTAYSGENMYEIPCRIESEFIENELNKYLNSIKRMS